MMKQFLLIAFALVGLVACGETVQRDKPCADTAFCENDRVLKDDAMGLVTKVLPEDKVEVLFDGADKPVSMDSSLLEKQVACFQEYCVNDRIIKDDNDFIAVIKTVFSKGTIQYKSEDFGYSGLATVDLFAKRFRCLDDLCVNSLSASSTSNVIVSDIYNNGKVRLKHKNGLTEIRSMESLEMKPECFNGKKSCEYKK